MCIINFHCVLIGLLFNSQTGRKFKFDFVTILFFTFLSGMESRKILKKQYNNKISIFLIPYH